MNRSAIDGTEGSACGRLLCHRTILDGSDVVVITCQIIITNKITVAWVQTLQQQVEACVRTGTGVGWRKERKQAVHIHEIANRCCRCGRVEQLWVDAYPSGVCGGNRRRACIIPPEIISQSRRTRMQSTRLREAEVVTIRAARHYIV